MQVFVGTLFYILNTHLDLVHPVHQLARFVHNPGPSHIKALDHVLHYLAGTGDLCLIIGNWTDTDLRFLAGFHSNADSSHKNVWIFVGLLALLSLLLVLFCSPDLSFKIRCLHPPVRRNIMLIHRG